MHYVINVSKNGKHFFATANHSLIDHDDAVDMAKEFKNIRFPISEGFIVTLSRVEISSTTVHI